MTSAAGRPAVQVALADTYRTLGAALAEALGDHECDVRAPWTQWRAMDADDVDPAVPWAITVRDDHLTNPELAPWRKLVKAGELAGVTAANTLRGHLSLLGRAYWPDINDPSDPVIMHPAIYPSARAVLETVAEVGWVLDPNVASVERTRRAAELLLWSQVARGNPDADWHTVARAAGLDVRGTRNRPEAYCVWVGDKPSALTMTRMVRTVLGDDGVALYNDWSGSTHPDPLSLAKRSLLTERPGGYGIGGIIREDNDVEVAANVADLVARAIECQAVYWGRSTAPADVCRAVAAELREFLPTVVDAVIARLARLGR